MTRPTRKRLIAAVLATATATAAVLAIPTAAAHATTTAEGVVTLADRPGMVLELVVLGRGSLVSSAPPSYKGHRYPVEVIAHCVWLCFRFPLSFREVEELMLERGVLVSHETVRRWCVKFGQA